MSLLFKKGIACLTILILCCSFNLNNTFVSYASEFDDEFMNSITDHDFYVRQNQSVKTYNQLLTEFAKESVNNNPFTFNFSLKNNEINIYPSYYGGAYINSKGKLIIKVAGVTEETFKQKLSAMCDIASIKELSYESCKVSYTEINRTVDQITDNLDYFMENGIFISEVSDDIIENRVIVGLKELSEENINFVNSTINVPYLKFIESDVTEKETTVGAGYAIVSTDNGGGSTLGFAAKRNGTTGFVISGHAGNLVGETFKYNGTTIGSVTHTAYYNNSTADAAFVKAASGITASYIVKNGGAIWGASTYSYPVGTSICLYGKASGLQTGTIRSKNTNLRYDNNTIIKQQWVGSYSSTNGDSGGPILFYDGAFSGQTKYTLVGIHCGTIEEGRRAFSPYSNIINELDVSCILQP